MRIKDQIGKLKCVLCEFHEIKILILIVFELLSILLKVTYTKLLDIVVFNLGLLSEIIYF